MIKNRILRFGEILWRECEWVQTKDLKIQAPEEAKKLESSLQSEGLASPFLVWESKNKKIFILDAHQRQKALLNLEAQGIQVPKKLPAAFIECKNLREAKKLVVIYHSQYSHFQEDILKAWLSEFKQEEFFNFAVPGIDFDSLLNPEDEKEKSISLSEKYLIPPFSIFDTRQGYWQERKKAWLDLGLKSELGRGKNLMGYSGTISLQRKSGGVPSNQNRILKRKKEYGKEYR
jgi:hypothetical protein